MSQDKTGQREGWNLLGGIGKSQEVRFVPVGPNRHLPIDGPGAVVSCTSVGTSWNP